MDIVSALSDKLLWSSAFPDLRSRAPWIAFLRALFGLPLTEDELDLYRHCTGRQEAPVVAFREAWVIVGRRSGKSRIAALVAVDLACFVDHAKSLSPGERGTLMVLAADRRQARTVFRYVEALIDGSPLLAKMVTGRTAEAVHLDSRISIEVHTSSFRSVRGYTIYGAGRAP